MNYFTTYVISLSQLKQEKSPVVYLIKYRGQAGIMNETIPGQQKPPVIIYDTLCV